jgi:hypothetical protein
MKANKALKRLAKIEALMLDVTERYSASAPIREVLQDAKAAVTRAKEAVSFQASSGTTKNPAVKHSKLTSKAEPEFSKPRRKLSAVAKAAIPAVKVLKKSWAIKKAGAAEPIVSKTKAPKRAAVKNAATAKTSAEKKAAPKKTAVKVAAKPREQAVTKSANAPAQSVVQAPDRLL